MRPPAASSGISHSPAPRPHAVPDPAEIHFWAAWHPAWALFAALALLAAVYFWGWRRARLRAVRALGPRQAVAYLAGLGAVAFALAGPLDAWNQASFSLHMLQHLCLVLVAAPLLVIGRPWVAFATLLATGGALGTMGRLFARRSVLAAWRLLRHPATAFLAFNGAMVLWHLPAAYVAALRQPGLHEAEHLSFLLGALLLWWQVLPSPPHRPATSVEGRALLLFGTALAGDVVAAGLSLSTRLLYPPYAGRLGLGGRDALADQRLGGLLMWVSGGLFYLLTFWVLWQGFRGMPGRRGAAGGPLPEDS